MMRKERKLDEILRVIELCKSIKTSSANPFEIDIREKIITLKKMLPDYKFLDELLYDAEAIYQLTQIVKLQDEWLKRRASSMYIDPLLIELKLRLVKSESLAEIISRSMHPILTIDQLSPKALERSFVYWRDLLPLSERFREEQVERRDTGRIEIDDLIKMNVVSKELFEKEVERIRNELASSSKGEWIDYFEFISREKEREAYRAYLLSFIVTDGWAEMRKDPITEKIYIRSSETRLRGEAKSFAVQVG